MVTRVRKKSYNETNGSDPSDLTEILKSIIATCPHPSRMVELHYWSLDPGVVEIIRTIVALPQDTRGVIEAFAAMVQDPLSVSAKLDEFGRLILSAPDIAKAMAVADYVVERGEEVPQLLS